MYNEKHKRKNTISESQENLTTMRLRQAVIIISFYDIFRLSPEVAKNY